jgi:hypothetical protein
MQKMGKQQLVNQFTKSIISEEQRKNKVSTSQVTSTLTNAGLNMAFVNESCKSTGQVSKSQVIYRKLKGKSLGEIQECFQENTVQFLKILKIYSRNRFFLNSFDTTKEAFYGDVSKAEDKMYLHNGSIAKGSEHYYEYLTVAITCNVTAKYILDGVMVPVGCYIEDYVYHVTKFVKEQLPIEAVLFDRGFGSWGVIYKLRKLPVTFLIFWKKQGDWYKEHFDELEDGECKIIHRESKYNRDKTNHKVNSDFVLIKQLEYDGKKYDWIFATNLKKNKAEFYVKLYKKRWGIETIYRVTDKIRIYTTSTNCVIRYFLFMFTCFVYNIWKFFQMFLGEDFTLANHKTNMTIFMAKHGMIYPVHYDAFEKIAKNLFDL